MEFIEKATPYMAIIFLQFAYAGSSILAKFALNQGMSHYSFAVYRNIFAAVAFTPFAIVLERPVLDQNLYYEAMKHTTATYASAMTNMLPAITFLFAWGLRLEEVNIKELPSQVKILGTIFTVGGAMIMTLVAGPTISFPWTGNSHTPTAHESPAHEHSIKGALMITAGCLCWASFFTLQAITVKSYPAVLSLTSLICTVGALQAGVVALVAEWHHPSVWTVGWDSILFCYIYYGIVISGGGYYVSGIIMRTKGPVFVTSFNPLSMVIVAMLSSFVFREKLTYGRVFGALVIIIGLYLVIWGKSRDHKTSSSCNNYNLEDPADQNSSKIMNSATSERREFKCQQT